jgi:nucleotide-binding universal stress UspA family protein
LIALGQSRVAAEATLSHIIGAFLPSIVRPSMIADIAVRLSPAKKRDVAGEFAISLATLFGAHLSAVAFAYTTPVAALGDGFATPAFDNWEAERKAEAEQAQQAFERRAKLAGTVFDCRVLSDDVENAALIFSEIARNYDIAVVAQAQPDDGLPETLAVESTLFDSGRPVVVVPYIQTEGINLNRVVVCWDGSRNAARAVGDALPLLKRAKKIDVVTVEHKEQREVLKGAQIAEHLARHKLDVDLKSIVAPEGDVANVILSQAADCGADLLVMGGYGHTRIREFVLGGATRGILGSMTVPVLMAH